MEVKCLEIRDDGTFVPVICVRPTPDNEAQRYLLCRDGYSGTADEQCVIVINAQCRGVAYDPYEWIGCGRTMRVAHSYIQENWGALRDGDVVDMQFILGESIAPKISERVSVPA